MQHIVDRARGKLNLRLPCDNHITKDATKMQADTLAGFPHREAKALRWDL